MSTVSETANLSNPSTDTAPKPSARERAREVEPALGIHLTEKAAAQIKEIMQKDKYPESMYLFVGVKGGGCSGLQYILDLRDESQIPVAETDEVFLSQGIVVVCDLKSFVVGNLAGTSIDYHDTVMASGFTFNNPNAKHSCGCGSSYSA